MRVRVRLRDPRRNTRSGLRAVRAFLLVFGAAAIGAYAWLQIERSYFGSQYLQQFEQTVHTSPPPREPVTSVGSREAHAPRAASLPVLARLRVPRLNLEVPVLEGVDARTLRRGAGWIPGAARPGETGNIGIAAHRDTFFRPLREVRTGDRIELETLDRRQSFVVRSVYVVEPDHLQALRPTAEPTLTLVTCFPFDYIGPAPRRYIVQAVLAD